jgi:Ran GTPase-activating protein (RanGAP) involved in mRNA processing and transport
MSENISNLVNAIKDGNALETENAFGAAIADKLADKLDAMRQDVAKNMFASPEAVMEDEPEVTDEMEVEAETEVEEVQETEE